MSKATVVSFINYKGGVGKTTSTYHIGCSLVGHHKKRVLLVDIDPQTNLTFLCAPIPQWTKFKSKTGTIATIYSRFQKKKSLDTKRYIWHAPVQVVNNYRITGLDLIPCDIELIGEDLGGGHIAGIFPSAEALKQNAKMFLRERSFIRALVREIEDKYDYVLIDCPPNLYLMTQNALVASDHYIVTAVPDHLSTIGLNILRKKVEKIGEMVRSAETFAGESTSPRHVADLAGVIFVKVRLGGTMTTLAHSNKMAAIRADLGPNSCFDTHTTELIGYSEAAEASVPVWAHDSDNARRAAQKNEYQDITQEFLKRF